MTRINVVPVECLTNSHLLAEYKEITRPFNKVIDRIEKYGQEKALDTCNTPEKYVLGSGHESFFFDKLSWLSDRYDELARELLNREFNIDWEKYTEIHLVFRSVLKHTAFWGTYTPTPEDMYLNMARLVKRSKLDNVIEELYSDT